MNYLQAELLEHLAAGYVLGTLQGRARLRFERVMMDSYKARQAVWAWEQRLTPMADTVSPVTPPGRVWRNIERRIAPTLPARGLGLPWWRGWSLFSTACLILLVALVVLRPVQPPGPDQIALFSNEKAQPLWLVSGNLESGRLSIKPINAEAVRVDNKAFELWMLPASGQPRSLGLLPVSGSAQEQILSPQLLAILQDSAGLAISLEPEGGSPTGLPTGPVLYQAAIVEL